MKIAIIGYGAYGAATAKLLNHGDNDIYCLTNDNSIDFIVTEDNIKISSDYEKCINGSTLVYVLTPAINTPLVFKNLHKYIDDSKIIILGSKGILENKMLIEESLKSQIPDVRYACLSGPSFARDIQSLNPIGFTLATKSKDDFNYIKSVYRNVKLEYSSDTTGVELCGVLKNAYAIGSGIIHGLNFGDSTSALYIMGVILEMKKILDSFGANPNTVYTLAGLGDTLLTCTSNTSRNYTFGSLLCTNYADAKKYLKKTTVEGYGNIKILYELFNMKNIDAPLLNTIYEIVFNKADPNNIINIILK